MKCPKCGNELKDNKCSYCGYGESSDLANSNLGCGLLAVGIVIAVIVGIVCLFNSCGSSSEKKLIRNKGPKYRECVKVECEQNVLFSTYDVKILIDDKEIGKIAHGDSEKYDIELAKGEHTIKFESDDENYVDGRKDFNVTKENEKFGFKIKCKSDEIIINLMKKEELLEE